MPILALSLLPSEGQRDVRGGAHGELPGNTAVRTAPSRARPRLGRTGQGRRTSPRDRRRRPVARRGRAGEGRGRRARRRQGRRRHDRPLEPRLLVEPRSAVSLPLQSFAGTVPENADALAMAHQATDAVLPPVPAGDLAKVHMTLKDMVVEIAPGVKYNTWAFDGHGAPGPVVHVRQGQTVEMTLTNGGAIPHSIDFHAARIAPNVAFKDVAPGESFTFRFVANDPGVFMYHCGTKPVLAHIANGMYGAIVVDPATPAAEGRQGVRAGRERVVHERRRDHRAGVTRHVQGACHDAGLDDLQRLRQPVRHPSADRGPGRDGPLLRRRRRPDARHRTSTSSARSSTAPG